ncbi:MAG: electron transfer flavoprotein subunit beta/FixA family protein [Balneolaceae bacterium]
MNIVVCIKQVPDIEAPARLEGGELKPDMSRMVLNAYDASAVEAALVLTEKHGGEVSLLLAGPESASETIRKALAMGAHRALHIVTDISPDEMDSANSAILLAEALKKMEFDFVFCGKQSQDSDAGLAGAMIAQKLGVPFVGNATALEWSEEELVVTRQDDRGRERIALPSPGLVTCSNDMNEPRIAGLRGIMQAKSKPLETTPVSELGLSAAELKARTVVRSVEEKPGRQAGVKLEGEPEELVREMFRLLPEEYLNE